MLFIAFTILLFTLYGGLFLYYRKAWKDIPDDEIAIVPPSSLPFVTVIIPARNEQQRIGNCLKSLTEQTYPKEQFEVLVINDFSEDSTSDVVRDFSIGFPQIKLIELSDYADKNAIRAYKKKAIETGVSLAQGDLIITTDADCTVPPRWIETIAGFRYSKDAEMIAAPVLLTIPEKGKPGFKPFYIFQILDFMTLQGITGAALHKQFHYMANGANFSYSKRLFKEVGGFRNIDDIPTGDDMLLVEKAASQNKDVIFYLKSRMAIVSTPAEPTLSLFFHQRIRWASKSTRYQDYKIKAVLSLIYLANAWIFLTAVSAFFVSKLEFLLLIIFAIKVAAELSFLFPVSKFFNRRNLLWWFVPLQPFHIIYILFAGWMGVFGSYHWRGRKIIKSQRKV